MNAGGNGNVLMNASNYYCLFYKHQKSKAIALPEFFRLNKGSRKVRELCVRVTLAADTAAIQRVMRAFHVQEISEASAASDYSR